MTPPRIIRTTSANKMVSPRNTASPVPPAGRRGVVDPGIATISASAATLNSPAHKGEPGDDRIIHPRYAGRSGAFAGPHRLAVGAGDRLPARLDRADHRGGHRHVVELLGQLPAAVIGPVEKAQHFACGVRLVLLV